MAAVQKFFFDVQNRKLVKYPGEGGSLSIASIFQYNVLPIEFTLVEETGVASAPYQKIDATGATLRAALGGTPQGTTGPSLLAFFDDFSWNSGAKKFVGTFPVNTTAVDSYIGSLPERAAFISFTIVEGGEFQTLLQHQVLIKATIDEGGSIEPTPTEDYYTTTESDNLYVKKNPAAGEVFKLKSPDGSKTMTFSLSNDGELIQTIT